MWHSLGYTTVITAGVPVRITTERNACQTVFFQQHQDNTGKLYICDRVNADKITGIGILVIIAAPTLNAGTIASVLPYAAVTIPTATGALDANQFWIDSDNDGEKCLVSYVRP